MATVIDQESAHRLRAQRQAVCASLPSHRAIVLQAHPRLVDEGRGLKRVVAPLSL
jgi:hypothetical protein